MTNIFELPLSRSPALGRGLVFAMAAATGVAVANIYYSQPMLGLIEKDLPGVAAGMIPTATQAGYALGLFLLVPLGDLFERRKLIVLQFVALAVALCLAAVAPTAGLVAMASLLVGFLSTVAQQIVPFAANLASSERRGAVVGIVMSGLLSGILLSRTLAGFVASHGGWRDMFWLGVPMALATAAVMAAMLPRSQPQAKLSYPALLSSLFGLWSEFPALRLSAISQAAVFATFTTFWTILALRLQEPQFALGADIAGLFGIIGAVGILAAPVAGRIADKRGPRLVLIVGALLTLVSWLIFGLWTSLIGLIVGVIVLDFAMQASLVSNQSVIFALRPEARARLNTILMGVMFVGGAIGSALATLAWDNGGWGLVSLLGIAFATLASVLQLTNFFRSR